ncbi:sigma-70 family RNA polymerase sigma factor [Baekduia sp.]|uniref:RNA polymerase sigma factor n=1 Tax=Baekduia sp. TaxID=2600305 RepID=UPI002E0A9ECE|nr:sigma-70 family RNA polymerase sigma factor [Baekduia sp.]
MEASALSHPVGLGRVSLAGPLLRLRSDDQLVALFRAGHEEAFGIIHDRYRQRLFAYARQMLSGSRSDAEDVLQDVFLRAYDALRADRRPIALRAWLYRVAHNRCIDQIRRPAPAPEHIYEVNRGVPSDPMAEADRREDLRRLIVDVRALPEQQRSALLMREMEGLSYNDLAEALGVTVPAIKSLLVRARVGLVEAIEARDTACVEIRNDLAAAFDRGVRASGRSRKHLRECAGCRDYRTALRGIEKQLNGLAPASGPLTAIAKILGIGGAGSGAAAGGGAAVLGGGAGAAAGGTTAATIGTGAVAATAGKVAAVMAAAAVVGGGAATVEQKVDHHRTPAAHVSHVAPTHATVPIATRQRIDPGRHVAVPTHVKTSHGAAVAPHVAHVRTAGDEPISSTGADVPKLEATTGGLQAPGDDATTTSDAPTGTAGGGTTSTGTATSGNGTTTGAGSTTASGTETTTATGTSGATTTTTSGSGAAPATGAGGTTAPASSTPAVADPIAQGAAVTPAG